MKNILLIFTLLFGTLLYGQNDSIIYLTKDLIEVELNPANLEVDIFYKNINTKKPYTGWILWSLKKGNFKIFQVKNGIREGYQFLYKKTKGVFELQEYNLYRRGDCWETVHCKNKNGKRIVKSVSLYFFRDHAIYHEIYDDNILWVDIEYKKKYYLIRKIYKNGDRNKIQKIKYKSIELEQKLVASIINDFDKLPFPFILNSLDDLPPPPVFEKMD